jgi:hypothetical protein
MIEGNQLINVTPATQRMAPGVRRENQRRCQETIKTAANEKARPCDRAFELN